MWTLWLSKSLDIKKALTCLKASLRGILGNMKLHQKISSLHLLLFPHFLIFFFKIPLNYWWQILEDNLTFWIPLQPISRSSRLEIENIVLSDAFYYPLYVLSVYHIQLFALETTRECINLSDISWSFTMHFNDDKTVVDILFNGEASFHQFSLFQTDHL